MVSAHPQNISLSLPTDLRKSRSIGPFYLAIIELNPKQRMGVNKSDSYIGCRRKNVKRPLGTKNVCEEADRFRILGQFFPSLSIQENHTAAPAYQTVVQRFHGCQVTINYGAALVFLNKAAIKHWQKLACTLAKFVASLPILTAKTVISKLLSLNYFMLFAFNGLNWFHKKTVNHFFIDVKRLLRMETPVFVSSTVTKSLVYHRKFLGFYHEQMIA